LFLGELQSRTQSESPQNIPVLRRLPSVVRQPERVAYGQGIDPTCSRIPQGRRNEAGPTLSTEVEAIAARLDWRSEQTGRDVLVERLLGTLRAALLHVVLERVGLVDGLLLALRVVRVDLGRLRVTGGLTAAEACAC
jgi:hypothetical protein